MKKLITVLLVIVCLLGCSSKNAKEEVKTDTEVKTNVETKTEEPETSIPYEMPAYLLEGCEEGDYAVYGVPDPSEELIGTMVYVSGGFDTVLEQNDGKANAFATLFKDEEGNDWMIFLDTSDYARKEDYDTFCGHQLEIIGLYCGVVDNYDIPVLVVRYLLDKKTGDLINPGFYVNNVNAIEEEIEAMKKETDNPEEKVSDNNVIRPEIKEAIDSYEEFVDEYCEFMKKIDSNNLFSDVSAMTNYYNMLEKLTEMEGKMDALEDDLNDAELAYYTEVMLRCSQKMLQVLQ